MKLKKSKNKSYNTIENLYSIIIQKYIRGYITRKKNGRIELCAICLEYNLNNENKCKLTCKNKHIFHEKCLNDWLNYPNSNEFNYNKKCPTCRSIIYPNRDYETNNDDNSENDANSQNDEENGSLFTRLYGFLTHCFENDEVAQNNQRYCCCF